MRISAINGFKPSAQNKQIENSNSQPNFTGITKLMKKKIYIDGKKDILKLIENRQETQSSTVGQLPKGMFALLTTDKTARAQAIKDIMTTFGQIAEEIRGYIPGREATGAEYRNRRANKTVEKLKNVFEKYNLTTKKEDVDLEFLGRGDYGSAFRIRGVHDEITNDDYIIKVFTIADKGPNWHRYKSHGNYAEVNTAEYWSNNWGEETQRGKFYFGDINKGYVVDNFIDQNTPPYKKLINEYTAGLKLTDEELAYENGHNKINGYSIDWGGVRVVNRIKNESKTARAVLNRIKKTERKFREIEWWKVYNSKSEYDKTQKLAGLGLAVKHLPFDKRPQYIDFCMTQKEPMVDQALGYLLKYMPHEQAKHYFEKLMGRNEEITQTILMNEIPLLARKPLPEAYDDMNVPKDQLFPDKIKVFFDIAKKHAVPESREHLASYVHLLPSKDIMPEFESLLKLDDYNVFDRLLHKIETVPEEEFPSGLKLEMLGKLEKVVKNPYLKDYTQRMKIATIRKTLED